MEGGNTENMLFQSRAQVGGRFGSVDDVKGFFNSSLKRRGVRKKKPGRIV